MYLNSFIASLYSCIDIIILRPERKFQHHLDGLSESLKQEISDSNFIVWASFSWYTHCIGVDVHTAHVLSQFFFPKFKWSIQEGNVGSGVFIYLHLHLWGSKDCMTFHLLGLFWPESWPSILTLFLVFHSKHYYWVN